MLSKQCLVRMIGKRKQQYLPKTSSRTTGQVFTLRMKAPIRMLQMKLANLRRGTVGFVLRAS